MVVRCTFMSHVWLIIGRLNVLLFTEHVQRTTITWEHVHWDTLVTLCKGDELKQLSKSRNGKQTNKQRKSEHFCVFWLVVLDFHPTTLVQSQQSNQPHLWLQQAAQSLTDPGPVAHKSGCGAKYISQELMKTKTELEENIHIDIGLSFVRSPEIWLKINANSPSAGCRRRWGLLEKIFMKEPAGWFCSLTGSQNYQTSDCPYCVFTLRPYDDLDLYKAFKEDTTKIFTAWGLVRLFVCFLFISASTATRAQHTQTE